MPRPFPPVLALTADHAAVAPIIADLDARDAFRNIGDPAAWTLDVIRLRQNGALTAAQACLLQEIVIDELNIPLRGDHWAILATTEVLPVLTLDKLDVETLRALMFHLAGMRRNVFNQQLRTPTQLCADTARRKAELASAPGAGGVAFAPLLDRANDRLTPFLR